MGKKQILAELKKKCELLIDIYKNDNTNLNIFDDQFWEEIKKDIYKINKFNIKVTL